MQGRYLAASREERGRLLDELAELTGLQRKSVVRLLKGPTLERQPRRQQRGRAYGAAVDDALRVIWESLDYSCAERLTPALVETAEQLLDQRHLKAESLARLLALAKESSERFAAEEDVGVAWQRIWSIEPILFDEQLIELADASIREVSGSSHRLPSGPLHDAAEVARAGVPTVMLFVQSLRGLSHTKLEDTKKEHLEMSVQALDRLTAKALEAFS